MLLCDRDIRNLCIDKEGKPLSRPLVAPYSLPKSGMGTISYGETHSGYDLSLANEIKIFINTGEVVDPKRCKDEEYCSRIFRDHFIENAFTMPAHSYILGRSYEYICMPDNLSATCVGKSTLARVGILINTTPVEPGWEGYLTIEIANTNPCSAVIYAMEGIAQLRFELLSGVPDQTYVGKKYHKQIGVTPARVL